MKHNFSYVQGQLHWGAKQKMLESLLANYQGPCYAYDLGFIRHRADMLKKSLAPAKVFYAVKANFNLGVLKTIREVGCGADVVSGGEILQAEKAGFLPQEIVFSGVGKTRAEIRLALEKEIYQINVESLEELQRIAEISRTLKKKARVVLRVNPDVSIQTHPYIATGLKENKFGISTDYLKDVLQILKQQQDWVECVGLSMHLGSQMLEFSGFQDALRIKKNLFWDLKKDLPKLNRFDFGGGLGILYDQDRLDLEEDMLKEYSDIVQRETADLVAAGVEMQTEPGRWIVGHGGVLLSQVQYIKKTPHKLFVVLDTGMHHLLRPALYQAEHLIYPLKKRDSSVVYDFVGPICESSDVITKNRKITELAPDDFVAIADSGAYGYSMASAYNLHPFPQEILI